MENKVNIETNIDEINGAKVEFSPSPLNVKVDLTDTINEAYKDSIKPTLQAGKNGLSFCFQFLASTIKPYMYEHIQEAKYRCMEIDKKLEEKYNKLPIENQAYPRTSILGPCLDTLKYNLFEDHIKDAFTNLLSNELDNRTQSKVLPSFVYIVEQLSKEDAKFLKIFHDNNAIEFRSIVLESINETESGTARLSKFILITKSLSDSPDILHTVKLNDLVIDNLCRLNLIYTSYSEWFTENIELYDSLYNAVANDTKIPYGETLSYSKGILKLTKFGENFIDICLS